MGFSVIFKEKEIGSEKDFFENRDAIPAIYSLKLEQN